MRRVASLVLLGLALTPGLANARIEPLRPRIEPLITRIVDQRLKTETVETPEATVVAISADVLFDFDSARVRAEAQPSLRAVVRRLNAGGGPCVRVTGYTDARGSTAYNQRLSSRRAVAVGSALRAHAACLRTEGRGERGPIASNESLAGRARNRRVEVRIDR